MRTDSNNLKYWKLKAAVFRQERPKSKAVGAKSLRLSHILHKKVCSLFHNLAATPIVKYQCPSLRKILTNLSSNVPWLMETIGLSMNLMARFRLAKRPNFDPGNSRMDPMWILIMPSRNVINVSLVTNDLKNTLPLLIFDNSKFSC